MNKKPFKKIKHAKHHALGFTQTEQCLIIRSCKIKASDFFNTTKKGNKHLLN